MHGPLPRQGPYPAPPPTTTPASQDGDGVTALLRVLWRRRATVVGVTALLLLLTALVLARMTPSYSARADIILEPRRPDATGQEAASGPPESDAALIASEIEVVTSRELLARVVQQQGLLRDPEFNAALGVEDGPLVALGLRPPAEVPPLAKQRLRTVDALRQRLTAQPVGRARVIAVRLRSADPRKAARLANAVAEAYLADRLAARRRAVDGATRALDAKVEELRQRVAAAEAKVAAYRRDSGLVDGPGADVNAQQIAALNTRLVEARARQAEADARLAQAERLLEAGGADSAAEVLESALIGRLRGQESDLRRQRAELATVYGPRHPKMINVAAQIDELRGKIAQEVRRIVQNLRNEAAVAARRTAALRDSLAAREREAAAQQRARVRLRQLEREAAAERELFSSFLGRLKQTSASQGLERPRARILSRATPPASPAAPNVPLILALAFMAALPCGVGAALLQEQFDQGVATLAEAEAVTGLPALALLPTAGDPRRRGRAPADLVLRRPASAYAEAVRGLHARLLRNDGRPAPRTVMVTSTLAMEGKTSLALALARSRARAGARVLLVEADLRRPSLAETLRLRPAPGLADILSRDLPLARAIRLDPRSDLHVLPAGRATPLAADLLAGERLAALLDAFARSYDLVVLDTPPALPVADAATLGRMVDRTVLVLRWRKTPRASVQLAAKTLREADAEVAGVVLARADPRRLKHDGAGEAAAYGRAARAYHDAG